MVGFYALVVMSVSLTLSKAIRDSESSAALQISSLSSNTGSVAVATAATSSYNIKRWATAWARCDFGSGGGNDGEGVDEGGSRNGGAPGYRPKASAGYAKTKSMLKKLTRASVAMIIAVMVIIASGLHQGTIAYVSLIRFLSLRLTSLLRPTTRGGQLNNRFVEQEDWSCDFLGVHVPIWV